MIWRRLKKSTPEEEAHFAEQMEEERLSAKDKFAMVASAILVIFVPCALILLALAGLILLLFGAW